MTDSRLKFWLFFLLKVDFAGFSDVVGHDVNATAGKDVILPCHLDPPFDVSKLTVEWTLNDRIVHLYIHRKDVYDRQDEQFKGRTCMFPDELVKGNISLKLSNTHEEDSGLYICHVPRLPKSQVKKGNVLLTVKPQNEAGGGDKKTQDDNEPTNNGQTGLIVGCVLGALMLIMAVLLK